MWENKQTSRQFQRKKILLIIKNYIIFVKYKILYKKYNQKQQENNFIINKLVKQIKK